MRSFKVMMPEPMDVTKVDIAVRKLRTRTLGAYKPPKVVYVCKLCPHGKSAFKTTSVLVAWAHSETHGPWDLEGSRADGHVLNLSAQAHRNGMAHPRGERLS